MLLLSQIRVHCSLITVPEILLKGVELSSVIGSPAASGLGSSSAFEKLAAVVNEDRRITRHVRLRKAIDAGLAKPEAFKRKPPETEAVDPELDEVAKRLMRRIRF